MEFHIEQQLTAPPPTVQEALLDPAFVRLTATIPKIGGAELLDLTRTDGIAHLRVRYRFTAPLSSAVTRLIDPEKLSWVDDATFDLAQFRSNHVLQPDNYADRLRAAYTSTLEASNEGTRWVIAGSLVVKAPLVGAKVAAVIVDGLREAVATQAAMLEEWNARRA